MSPFWRSSGRQMRFHIYYLFCIYFFHGIIPKNFQFALSKRLRYYTAPLKFRLFCDVADGSDFIVTISFFCLLVIFFLTSAIFILNIWNHSIRSHADYSQNSVNTFESILTYFFNLASLDNIFSDVNFDAISFPWALCVLYHLTWALQIEIYLRPCLSLKVKVLLVHLPDVSRYKTHTWMRFLLVNSLLLCLILSKHYVYPLFSKTVDCRSLLRYSLLNFHLASILSIPKARKVFPKSF